MSSCAPVLLSDAELGEVREDHDGAITTGAALLDQPLCDRFGQPMA
jgi:hypothetical protein